jgi:hypothetical protein
MKTGKKLFFIAAVMITAATSGICFASDDGDFQYWGTAEIAFDVNKDWRITFQEELRFGESAGNLYYQHTETQIVYRGLADWIDVGLGYRQVFEENSSGEWKQENQPNLNITLRSKLLGLDVSNRARFEYRDLEDRDNLWRYRNKVAVKFPLELTKLKLQPYVADEIFIPLNDDNVNKNRFYAGVSLKLTKNLKGELYYLWESSRGTSDWTDINVLGTSLKFSF